MNTHRTSTFLLLGIAALATAALAVRECPACTRVLYQGADSLVITGRSMDWKEECHTDLWLFPRGMERSGETPVNPLRWTSKYGSVIASAYDLCSTDGMNEAGLVANLLWLAESEYPRWTGEKPGLTIAAWVQFMLDNFATVDEAVRCVAQGRFEVVSDRMPDGSRLATLHLSLSDATGDSAIFEYVDGKLRIHHDRSYRVMTNSPVFDSQLALNHYWQTIGGLTFLPGTNRAADRFVRASFYVDALPRHSGVREALAGVLGVVRNVSVPLGISTPQQPEIASTRWRTIADQKNRVYFYESTLDPNVIWVEFDRLDFSEGAPVRKLDLENGAEYTGEVSARFVEAQPFKFLGPTA